MSARRATGTAGRLLGSKLLLLLQATSVYRASRKLLLAISAGFVGVTLYLNLPLQLFSNWIITFALISFLLIVFCKLTHEWSSLLSDDDDDDDEDDGGSVTASIKSTQEVTITVLIMLFALMVGFAATTLWNMDSSIQVPMSYFLILSLLTLPALVLPMANQT